MAKQKQQKDNKAKEKSTLRVDIDAIVHNRFRALCLLRNRTIGDQLEEILADYVVEHLPNEADIS